MAPCGGKDMWRRTQGCENPRSANPDPAGDLPCDTAPGIYAAGYCDCKDGIPRHFDCGTTKKPCEEVCAAPPPPSSLSAAFATKPATPPPAAPAPAAKPWWQDPTVVTTAAVLLALVAHHVLTPARTERQMFARLVADQRREIAFEKTWQ